MREIKFRQFFRRKIHYWGYVDNGFIAPLATAEAHDCESGQYTGLKDKNGKEIYEGDWIIMKVFKTEINFPTRKIDINYEGIVKFFQSWNGYVLEVYQKSWEGERKKQGFPIHLYSDCKYELEIIGNVYENPDLLEPPLGNNAEPIRKISEDDWRKDDR